ncbi:DgyrCDS5372 [Dimorphilus gyrociliatus]|uniref:DgyrCDS5372 n=1 Tax=Dimorphilus gyrociliatus TaxID=2664684 RepID=A0A7I8VKD6_9ANNE|nr:DgyrCDS5372 [Dimorphilus gyrociliatus]
MSAKSDGVSSSVTEVESTATNGFLDVPMTNGISTPESAPSSVSTTGPDSGSPTTTRDEDQQQQHVVHVHINPGETFTVQVGDQFQHIPGPATVRMVSNNGPPMPMPMHVPPGHMVQQIVDENGILTHVILSAQPPPPNSGTPAPQQTTVGYYNGGASGTVLPHLAFTPTGFGQASGTAVPQLHYLHPCIPQQNHNNNHMDERGAKIQQRLRTRLINRNSNDQNRQQNRISSNANRSTRSHLNGDSRSGKTSNVATEVTSSSDEEFEIGEPLIEPAVSNITEHCATVTLQLPSPRNPADNPVEYELQLLEPGQDGNKFKAVYKGDATEITLQDLRPGSKYVVRICATKPEPSSGVRPAPSDQVSFHTLPDHPEAPVALKIHTRFKSALVLKWSTPSFDNGSKITNYVLQQQQQIGCDWIEIYRGQQKQYKVTKLSPNTEYIFRVAAVNSMGMGPFSDTLSCVMSGAAPSVPSPPQCVESRVNWIKLRWDGRGTGELYTVQMEDSASGHGFLPVYHGADSHCTVPNLRRNTSYKFRLAASNEDGQSRWSDAITASTRASTPGSPKAPTMRSRPQPHHARIGWDEPSDTGGSDITGYKVELHDSHISQITCVYEGTSREYDIENLRPGGAYRVRILAKNEAGWSEAGDWLPFHTTCVAPSRLVAPWVSGKAKATSFQIKWSPPEDFGGSSIVQYALQMSSIDGSTRQVYEGVDLECTVAGLQPGKGYALHVRATNAAGLTSNWSPALQAVSGPGVPDAPFDLQAVIKSPSHTHLTWQEPANNGAFINEYKLEWNSTNTRNDSSAVSASAANTSTTSGITGSTTASSGEEESENSECCRTATVSGGQLFHDLRSLTPATNYEFKVQAINVAGAGMWSKSCSWRTTPSSPAPVQHVRITAEATSVQVEWRRPACHGSPITHYQLDVGERHLITVAEGSTTSRTVSYVIDNLTPETTYRLRVQAVNALGEGAFATPVRFTTRPLPPIPPRIDCTMVTPNSLRLKWGEKNSEQIKYALEMLRDSGSSTRGRSGQQDREKSFHVIFYGTAQQHKVSRLSEMTAYHFRIRASNEAGDGPYSESFTFHTSKAPPPAVKAPRILRLTNDTATIEWTAVKPMGRDTLHYVVQLANRDSPLHDVHRGPDTQYVLTRLAAKANHEVRVCCVRVSEDGSELQGAYSPLVDFVPSTPVRQSPNTDDSQQTKNSSGSWRRPRLSEQQWAFLLLVAFGAVAVLVAICSQQIMSVYSPTDQASESKIPAPSRAQPPQ